MCTASHYLRAVDDLGLVIDMQMLSRQNHNKNWLKMLKMKKKLKNNVHTIKISEYSGGLKNL